MKRLSFVLIALLLILVGFTGCSQLKGVVNQDRTLTIISGNTNGGSGEVSPEFGSHQYKSHQKVIVTATPDPGSLFAGWQGINGVLSEMSVVDPSKPSSWLDYKIDVAMDRDVTLTALFFRAFNLTINVNGSGTVRIQQVQGLSGLDETMFTGDISQNSASSHVYSDGEYVTFTVVPGSGATFTGWTWNGDMQQIDPQYLPLGQPFTGKMTIPLDPLTNTVTVYMDHNINLTANFASVK